ncbi:hypothetical protein C8R44DRAFT_978568 [Mycena epipterygia]|nr:hypothetical protein C8R44DRAFT_978568 [Mycena epipterygia]
MCGRLGTPGRLARRATWSTRLRPTLACGWTREALAEQLSDWRWFGVKGDIVVRLFSRFRYLFALFGLLFVSPVSRLFLGVDTGYTTPTRHPDTPVSVTPTRHPTPAWHPTPTRLLSATPTGTPGPLTSLYLVSIHADKALDADKAPHAHKHSPAFSTHLPMRHHPSSLRYSSSVVRSPNATRDPADDEAPHQAAPPLTFPADGIAFTHSAFLV